MEPFLKWAGGKRWLSKQNILPFFGDGRLIEPFAGGAAIFFHYQPSAAILSDVNPELINLYRVIRDFPEEFGARLTALSHCTSSDDYYRMRSIIPCSDIDRAVRTLYLNRLCWNGLYRVNLKGEFNVPRGTKNSVNLPSDDFPAISELLRRAELECCDFESTISKAEHGDFVFVDPPYTVHHNMNGFLKYNENIFTWSDQIRLRDSCVDAMNRGAVLAITNADHPTVRELYAGIAEYRSIGRNSVIAGSSVSRKPTTEALFVIRAPGLDYCPLDPAASALPLL